MLRLKSIFLPIFGMSIRNNNILYIFYRNIWGSLKLLLKAQDTIRRRVEIGQLWSQFVQVCIPQISSIYIGRNSGTIQVAQLWKLQALLWRENLWPRTQRAAKSWSYHKPISHATNYRHQTHRIQLSIHRLCPCRICLWSSSFPWWSQICLNSPALESISAPSGSG